ncbi:MAG: ABC transporter substrate-binding protein [Deferribacteraceae bacterium]|jgi:branched-chain amino acid transport system substrate-binding protein|nr:ABC transporter substrate-binding protein [Deferribacteraceae bacterium]
MPEGKFVTSKIQKLARFAFFLSFLLLALLTDGCFPKQKQEEYITIGALLPLTGESSDEGLRAANALYIAKEEINANGGVLGKKLDIIVLNDRGDEDYIVEQYNVLKRKGIAAIIGSSYSDVTIALAKASEKDGIPVISPSASNPGVTKGRKNVFRAIFIDEYQAEAMASFAYNSLNAKTAVVMSNKNSDGLRQISDVFIKFFEKYGGQITAIEIYSEENDFKSILKKYETNPPDIIFCPEDYVPAAKLVNAVYESGIKNMFILGTDAWDGILTYVYHPDAMKNVYYTSPFSFDDDDPAVAQFTQNYFDSFSQIPLSGSATAYTCVYILSEAIKKAGNTNWDDIISAMKVNETDVITGHIKYDENNNPRTNVYIIQIKGGVYSVYKKINM